MPLDGPKMLGIAFSCIHYSICKNQDKHHRSGGIAAFLSLQNFCKYSCPLVQRFSDCEPRNISTTHQKSQKGEFSGLAPKILQIISETYVLVNMGFGEPPDVY